MTLTIERSLVATASFPAVSLAELAAHAALQTRVDRKYLLNLSDVGPLLDGLPPGTCVLLIDERRSFAYESVYFDTAGLDSYLDAAHRRRHRYKVRTRTYADSGLCRLEVKTRDGRSRTVKTALHYDAADSHRMTPAAMDHVAAVIGANTGGPAMAPVLRTSYRRTTFLLPHERTRMTVDTAVRVASPTLPGSSFALDHLAIVETKGASRPGDADRLLWALGRRPLKISKYGTGMALLQPDLPANKWAPALRRIRAGADTSIEA